MPVNMNRVVNMIPTLVQAIGSGYQESGLLLTKDASLPYGKVFTFQSADAVKAYFGGESPLSTVATVYFNGPDGKTKIPGELLIANYNLGNSNGWVRGAQYAGKLADLTTISSGFMTLVIAGESVLISEIDFTSATSFTQCASVMQTAIQAVQPTLTCSYDLIRQAFQITGTPETDIDYCVTDDTQTGTDLAAVLNMTATAGAVVSAPFSGNKPLPDIMDAITLATENWFSFTTDWLPEMDERLSFSAWNSGKYAGARFVYVEYDRDGAALVSSSDADFASQVKSAGYVATMPIYGDLEHSMFALGCGAAVNRNEINGRYALAGKHQSGLTVTVDSSIDYDTLIAKGYSCYADFATAGNVFRWFQNGAITGPYKWFDALQGHVWMNDGIQVNCAAIIDQVKAFPYADPGYNTIAAGITQQMDLGVANGVVTPGVDLSDTQNNMIMSQVGKDVSSTLFATGYYIYIKSPEASVRADRGSPIVRTYYNDGGVIQKIDVISAAIQ